MADSSAIEWTDATWNPVTGCTKIADTGVFEVLINFPLDMAINRLLTVDGKIPATWLEQLNAFFPDGWWEEAYTINSGMFADILGAENLIEKRPDARDRLLKFYSHHLEKAFGFVSKPKLIKNTRGHPLYYLLWAGSHPAGLKGANCVLKMGETLPSGRRHR